MSERIIYDGSDLMQTMNEKLSELEQGLNDMLTGGVELALAEKKYREKLYEWTTRLKKMNTSAGLIDKIVMGIDEVAEARQERDVAQVIYDVRKEKINITKLEIRILENQIEREYGGYTGGN